MKRYSALLATKEKPLKQQCDATVCPGERSVKGKKGNRVQETVMAHPKEKPAHDSMVHVKN